MIIPEARATQDATAANIAGDSSVAFIKTAADAISTSMGSKTNSATVTFTGKSGSDVMAVLQELRRKGYKVSSSGTAFTITW